MGLGIALLLPHLDRRLGAACPRIRADADRLVRPLDRLLRRARGDRLVLLTPITLLMGGTLTLLIRHLVRRDVDIGGRRIAVLYAVNTAGAALGCFLTDFALVPRFGLLGTQMIAVAFNLVAGAARGISRARASDVRVRRPYAVSDSGGPSSQESGCSRTATCRRGPAEAGHSTYGGRPTVASPHVASLALAHVGLRGDGDGDPLVPSLHDPARRVPRRVLAAADGHPDRHRRGLARVRFPASAARAAPAHG